MAYEEAKGIPAAGLAADLAETVQKNRGSAALSGPPLPTTRHDLRALQCLRRIIRGVELYSRQLSSEHNVTVPQLVCLLTVVEKGALTVASIAREAYLSSSTVVGILDRLEEKGLVTRQRSREDRRLVHVSATEAGAALAAKAPSPLHGRFTAAFRALPREEQERIVRSLEQIVEFIEAGHLDAAPVLETGPVIHGTGPDRQQDTKEI